MAQPRSRRLSAPPALVLVAALFAASSFAESNSDNAWPVSEALPPVSELSPHQACLLGLCLRRGPRSCLLAQPTGVGREEIAGARFEHSFLPGEGALRDIPENGDSLVTNLPIATFVAEIIPVADPTLTVDRSSTNLPRYSTHLYMLEDQVTLRTSIVVLDVGRYQLAHGLARMGGLTGSYFDNTGLQGDPVLTHVDRIVDFDWGLGDIAGVSVADYVAVRWCGYLGVDDVPMARKLPKGDRYVLWLDLGADTDGARLWINGTLIIDAWSREKERLPSASVQLKPGTLNSITLEYRHLKGNAVIRLLWSSPWATFQPIPSRNLFHATAVGHPVLLNINHGRPFVSSLIVGHGLSILTAGAAVYFKMSVKDAFGNTASSLQGGKLILGISQDFRTEETVTNTSTNTSALKLRPGIDTAVSDLTGGFGGLLLVTKAGSMHLEAFYGSMGALSATYYTTNNYHYKYSTNELVSYSPVQTSLWCVPLRSNLSANLPDQFVSLSLQFREGYAARWSGFLKLPNASDFALYTRVESNRERMKLWIDNSLLINQWSSLQTLQPSGTFTPTASDKLYNIVLDYHDGLDSVSSELSSPGLFLEWESPVNSGILTPRAVIPNSYFFSAMSLVAQRFQVLASRADPKTSTLQSSPAATAGSEHSFDIVVRDEFGNTARTHVDADDSAIPCNSEPLEALLHQASQQVEASLQRNIVCSSCARSERYTGGVTPLVSGHGSIWALLGGFHIQGSPIHLDVNPGLVVASRSDAQGNGLSISTAGVQAEFKIYAKDEHGNLAYPRPHDGEFVVQISSKDSDPRKARYAGIEYEKAIAGVDMFPLDMGPLQCVPEQQDASTWKFSFLLTHSGSYFVDVTWAGVHISGSPFSCNVAYGSTCATTSLASGEGFTVSTAGTRSAFSIFAHDAYGNTLGNNALPSGQFFVTKLYSEGGPEPPKHLGMNADDRAIHQVPFTVTRGGNYSLQLFLASGGGLAATYYSSSGLLPMSAKESVSTGQIIDWSSQVGVYQPEWDSNVSQMQYGARWAGFLKVPPLVSQSYTFFASLRTATERMKLWIDTSLLVDQWTSLASTQSNRTIKFAADTGLYDIRIEYSDSKQSNSNERGLRLQAAREGALSNLTTVELFRADRVVNTSHRTCSARATANQTKLYGKGLTLLTAGVSSLLTLVAKDVYGNAINGFVPWIQTSSESASQYVTEDTLSISVTVAGIYRFEVKLLQLGGLQATFYSDTSFSRPTTSGSAIANLGLLSNSPLEAAIDYKPSFYSVRWTGYFKAPYEGEYTFFADISVANRMVVNGTQIFDYVPTTHSSAFGFLSIKNGSQPLPYGLPITLEMRHTSGLRSFITGLDIAYTTGGTSNKAPISRGWLTFEDPAANSPFTSIVVSAPVCASRSIPYGPGLTVATAGVLAIFYVQSKDGFSNNVVNPYTTCTTSINCDSGESLGIVSFFRTVVPGVQSRRTIPTYSSNGRWDVLVTSLTVSGNYRTDVSVAYVGGLDATYYSTADALDQITRPTSVVQVDQEIFIIINNNTRHQSGSGFAVRWAGLISIPCSTVISCNESTKESFAFGAVMNSADRVKVWLDNRLIIDEWSSLSVAFPEGTIGLDVSDRLWNVIIEYKHASNTTGTFSLNWGLNANNNSNYTLVPSSKLYRSAPVGSSPYVSRVWPAAPSGSYLSFSALTLLTAGVSSYFTVTARDRFNNPSDFGDLFRFKTQEQGSNASFFNPTIENGTTTDGLFYATGTSRFLHTQISKFTSTLYFLQLGGLFATYYQSTTFIDPKRATVLRQVDLCPSTGCGDSPLCSNLQDNSPFSVKFDGAIQPVSLSRYQIRATVKDSSDRFRVWFDNALVIDQWDSLAGFSSEIDVSMMLLNAHYDIAIEYRHSLVGIGFGFRLEWKTSSEASYTIIPSTRLYQRYASSSHAYTIGPAITCYSTSTATGFGLTLSTAGMRSVFTITARDEYGNAVSQDSSRFIAFVEKDGSALLSEASQRGQFKAAQVSSNAGRNPLSVAMVRNGGLTQEVYDNAEFRGVPSITYETLGPLNYSWSQHVLPWRTGTSSSIRWLGFLRAESRVGVGLMATYYSNTSLLPSQAVKAFGGYGVDFSKPSAKEMSISDISLYSVRWSGFLKSTYSQPYSFYTNLKTDEDRVKLWIDSMLLINQWTSLSSTRANTAAVSLKEDAYHSITIEYAHAGPSNTSGLSVLWSSSHFSPKILPKSSLLTKNYSTEQLLHTFYISKMNNAVLSVGESVIVNTSYNASKDEKGRLSGTIMLEADLVYKVRLECANTPVFGGALLQWSVPYNPSPRNVDASQLFFQPPSFSYISGSPFEMFLAPLQPDASQSIIRVISSDEVFVGFPVTFQLTAFDSKYNRVPTIRDPTAFLLVLSHAPKSYFSFHQMESIDKTIRHQTTSLTNSSDATFMGNITTTAAGIHTVQAWLAIPGGLSATYYSDVNFEKGKAEASSLWNGPLDWSTASSPDKFPQPAARWSGFLLPSFSGSYNIRTILQAAHERVKLWVDNLLLIDNWNSLSSQNLNGSIALFSNRYCEIIVEYRSSLLTQNRGLSLQWNTSSGSSVVTSNNLFSSHRVDPANSPIQLKFLPSKPEVNTSYARGYGLSVATVGFLSSFTVLAKDEYGNEPFSGDNIAIKADGTRNIVIDKLLVYGNGDSSFAANATTNGSFYAVSYTPEHSGLHSLTATFSREGKTHHISGSPFELVVHWAPIISAIHSTVRGTGLTLSSAGVAVTFIITARDKTMNQLHSGVPAHVGLLVGRRTINDCLIVHDQASATMSIRYSAPQSGTHFFNICAGKDEGLFAQYFLDEDLKNELFEQLDAIVDFDWRLGRPGSPLIPGDVNAGSGFGIRWTGYVTPYLPQLHTFGLEVAEPDERVKLWVDEQLLVDQWNSISTIRPTGTILVCAGTAYPIRIEYFNNKGTCAASLTWESNGNAGNIVKRPIPGRFLHPVCEPFQGSPFLLKVEPGNADKYSVVSGTGLTIGTAGVSSNFIIAARDKQQNLGVLGSSDKFYGALQSSGGKSPSVLREAAFDASRGLGRYTWTGTPYSTGMDSSLVSLISSGGLGATYFDGPFLLRNKAVASSVSEVLDWSSSNSFVQEWPDMLPADSFSARWAGYIGSRVASVYTFHVNMQGAHERISLWIDNVLILDQWISLLSPSMSGTVFFNSAGQLHEIKLEYSTVRSNNTAQATQLSWKTSEMATPSIVPSESLFYARREFTGLTSLPLKIYPSFTCASTSSVSGISVITSGVTSTFVIQSRDEFLNSRSKEQQDTYVGAFRMSDLCNTVIPRMCMLDADGCNAYAKLDKMGKYSLNTAVVRSGGLLAVVYNSSDFTSPIKSKSDKQISFDWGYGSPAPDEIPYLNPFSVKWFGYVAAPLNCEYTFSSISDSGASVRINSQVIISYTGGLGPKFGALYLEMGMYYPLEVSYSSRGRPSFMQLRWSCPSEFDDAIVPPNSLYFPGSPLSNSPMASEVRSGKIFAGRTTARGDGITLSTAGVQSKFSVFAYDRYGNIRTSKKDSLLTQIEVNPNSNAINQSRYSASGVTTPSLMDDSYEMTFTITRAGEHTLFSRLAVVGGLGATFYSNTSFAPETAVHSRVFETIDFSGTIATRNLLYSLAGGLPALAVRWAGFVRAPVSAIYTIETTLLGEPERIRLWIENKLLIDQWSSLNASVTTRILNFDDVEHFYSIKFEYEEGEGSSPKTGYNRGFSLIWQTDMVGQSSISLDRAPISKAFLYDAVDIGLSFVDFIPGGLQATFYDFLDLTGPRTTLQVPSVDFSSADTAYVLHPGVASSVMTNTDTFSVRWMGFIRPEFSQSTDIQARIKEADERVRLWIDDVLVIDQWNSLDSLGPVAPLNFECGEQQQHSVVVHYSDLKGSQGLSLAWNSSLNAVLDSQVISRDYWYIGVEVKSSPFTHITKPGPFCASNSLSRGLALTMGTAGVISSFRITFKDGFDNFLVGDDKVILSTTQKADQGGSGGDGLASRVQTTNGVMIEQPPYSIAFPAVTKAGKQVLFVSQASIGALHATYFDGIECNPGKEQKTDEIVKNTFRMVPETIGLCLSDSSLFSVRWRGFIYPAYAETYTFQAGIREAADRVRLWIDHKLVIDQWASLGLSGFTPSGTGLFLRANMMYDIKMEYKKVFGRESGASLNWQSASSEISYISSSRFAFNNPILGSPFESVILPATVCGSQSFALGSGYTVATAGTLATFSIRARDDFINYRSTGGDKFAVESQFVSETLNVYNFGVVEDFSNGTYFVTYPTLTKAGFFSLVADIAVQGGLQATYYDDTELRAPKGVKVDTRVTLLSFGSVRPNNALSDAGTFSVRWLGNVLHEYGTPISPEVYTYVFQLRQVDERVRMWIDHRLIIDQWVSLAAIAAAGWVNVTESQRFYHIEIKYKHQYGDAAADLRWRSSRVGLSDVTSEYLYQAYPLKGSPQVLFNHPGAACAAKTIATSQGLTQARVCTPVSFTIIAKDQFSNLLTKDAADLYVRLYDGREDIVFGPTFSGIYNDFGTLTYIPNSRYAVAYTSVGSGKFTRATLVSGNGLIATYYDGLNLSPGNQVATKIHPNLDFSQSACEGVLITDCVTGQPNGVTVANPNQFSIRWGGLVRPGVGFNTYTFFFHLGETEYIDFTNQLVKRYEERVRIWIDNQLVVNQWTSLQSTVAVFVQNFPVRRYYDIRIDYKTFQSNRYAWKLEWRSCESTAYCIPNPAVVPRENLFYDYDINGSPFIITAPPIVYLAVPGNGPTTGGTKISVIGEGFGTLAECGVNTFVGQSNSFTTWLSPVQLTALTPAGVDQGHNITVQIGTLRSLPVKFARFTYDAPTIWRADGTNAPATGGNLVTILGQNIGTADYTPRVRIGGTACEATFWLNNNEVICQVPGGFRVAREILLTVTNRKDRAGTLSKAFTYDSPITFRQKLTKITFRQKLTAQAAVNGILPVLIGSVNTTAVTAVTQHSSVNISAPAGDGTNLNARITVDNQVSSTMTPIFSYDKPSVTNISPKSVPTTGNQIIVLRGENFGLSPSLRSVRVGDTQCLSVPRVSHQEIECMVPPGVGQLYRVVVQVGSQDNSATAGGVDLLFSYNSPRVGSLLPGNGPSLARTVITFSGTNFGTLDYSAKGSIGKTACAATMWTSDTRLACMLQAGLGTGFDAEVVVADQLGSLSGVFSFDQVTLTELRPRNGPTSGQLRVTAFGKNFGTFDSTPGVSIGATESTNTNWATHTCNSVTRKVCWTSDTSIAFIPAYGSGTSKDISVSILGRQSTLTIAFSYDKPTITAINPLNGPTGGSNSVTVYGMNFGTTDSNRSSTLNSISVTVSYRSHQDIVVNTPAGTGASRQVQVTVEGQSTTFSGFFCYDAPVVTSINPEMGPAAGSTSLTVQGINFGSVGQSAPTAITVNGAACTSLALETSTKFTCAIPPNTRTSAGNNCVSCNALLIPVAVSVDGQTGISNTFSYSNDGSSQSAAAISCQALKIAFAAGNGAANALRWVDHNVDGDTSDASQVYCLQTVDGGGWTKVLQYGINGYTPTPNTSGVVATALTVNGKLSDMNINLIGGPRVAKLTGTLVSASSKSLFTLGSESLPFANFWLGYAITMQSESRIITAYSSDRKVTVSPAFTNLPNAGAAYSIAGPMREYRIVSEGYTTTTTEEIPRYRLFLRSAQQYVDTSFGQGIATGKSHAIAACLAASYSACTEWVTLVSPGYIDSLAFGFSVGTPGYTDDCNRYMTDYNAGPNRCLGHFKDSVTFQSATPSLRCFITGSCAEGAIVSKGVMHTYLTIYVRNYVDGNGAWSDST